MTNTPLPNIITDSGADPTELESPLDRGEATPDSADQQPKNPEVERAEQMDRLKANFHNALALRASIVQIGLALPGINGEYHLPELGSLKPLKTQELERDIQDKLQKLESNDEVTAERAALQNQLETLVVEYLYNTAGFFQDVYNRGLSEKLSAIRLELSAGSADTNDSHQTTIDLAKTALQHLEVMGKFTTTLESLQTGARLIMNHVYHQPADTANAPLLSELDLLNQSLRAEMGRNPMAAPSTNENPASELANLISELVDKMQLTKISQLKTAFQDLIASLEGRANPPTQTPAPDDLPSGDTVDQFLSQLDTDNNLPPVSSQHPAQSKHQLVLTPNLPAPSAASPSLTQPSGLAEMLERLDPAGGKIQSQPPVGSGEPASPSPDTVAQDVAMGE